MLTVLLGGDVMFGRWRGGEWRPHINEELLAGIGELRAQHDLTLVNQEMAFCVADEAGSYLDEARKDGPNVFATPPEEAARLAGLADAVTVANNHSADCGPASDQPAEPLAVGVQTAETPVDTAILTVADAEVAILALSLVPPNVRAAARTVAWAPAEEAHRALVSEIQKTRREHPAALIVVTLHWGREGAERPDVTQRELALALLEEGANIIHGHGAHVLQKVEQAGNGLVAWNLGDLHFDGDSSEEARMLSLRWERCPGDEHCAGGWRLVGYELLSPIVDFVAGTASDVQDRPVRDGELRSQPQP